MKLWRQVANPGGGGGLIRSKRIWMWLAGLVVALTIVASDIAPTHALPPPPTVDNPTGGVPDPGPLPGENDPPVPPEVSLLRPERDDADEQHKAQAHGFEVVIKDRSPHDLSTRLERRRWTSWVGGNDDPWVTVRHQHRLSGTLVVADEGLDPDTRYCYRAVASNFAGSRFSENVCAVTRAVQPQPLVRIQLQVFTADIDGAGTREKRTAVSLAPGNSTWLDLPGPDFAPGTVRMYDLIPPGTGDMSEIERIRLSGGADDPWCVDRVRLLVNLKEVFQEDFDGEPDGCRWLGGSSSSVLVIDHRTLREHPSWVYARPLPDSLDEQEVRVKLDASELRERLQSLIGHAIHGQDVHWRFFLGQSLSDSLLLSRSDALDDAVHVKAKFVEEKSHLGLNLDLDFDLRFAVQQDEVGGDIRLTVEPRNVDPSLQIGWLFNILDLLPCGPVASIITGDGIPRCLHHFIERPMEKQIRSGLGGVGLDTTIGGDARCCTSLDIEVAEDGGVTLVMTLDQSNTSAGSGQGSITEIDPMLPVKAPESKKRSALTFDPVLVPDSGDRALPHIKTRRFVPLPRGTGRTGLSATVWGF